MNHASIFFALVMVGAGSVLAQTNTFPTSGSVGIGTTSPVNKLHIVAGDETALKVDTTAAGDNPAIFLAQAGTNRWEIYGAGSELRFFDYVANAWVFGLYSGNVGIGTTSPTEKLHVRGNAIAGGAGSHLAPYSDFAAQGNPFLELKGDSQADFGIPAFLFSVGGRTTNRSYGGAILWSSSDYTTADKRGAMIQNMLSGSNYTDSDLRFLTRLGSDSGVTERMRITAAGNVGIGTASPTAKLSVVATNTGPAAFYMPRYYYVYLVGSDPTNGGAGLAFATKDGAGVEKTGYVLQDPTHGLKFLTDSTERMIVSASGNVGIGTMSPAHKLAVNGTIKTKEVIVETTGWADHVFADDYRLAPLAEVEAHIREKKHLPGVPSAATVAEQGISLGEMQAKLLEKIEELTLHAIEREKRYRELEQVVRDQAARIASLEADRDKIRFP